MADSDQELMNTREAAAYLHVSTATLTSWRSRGNGPPYRKHGGRVVYALEDLRAWSELRRFPSKVTG